MGARGAPRGLVLPVFGDREDGTRTLRESRNELLLRRLPNRIADNAAQCQRLFFFLQHSMSRPEQVATPRSHHCPASKPLISGSNKSSTFSKKKCQSIGSAVQHLRSPRRQHPSPTTAGRTGMEATAFWDEGKKLRGALWFKRPWHY